MKFLHLCCDSILVVAVEECHEQIHNEEDAEKQVYNEEDGEWTAVLVCGKHNVWAVCRCQKHEHVEARGNVVWKVADTFH